MKLLLVSYRYICRTIESSSTWKLDSPSRRANRFFIWYSSISPYLANSRSTSDFCMYLLVVMFRIKCKVKIWNSIVFF